MTNSVKKALVAAGATVVVGLGVFWLFHAENFGLMVLPTGSATDRVARTVELPGDGREHRAAIVSRKRILGLRWGGVDPASIQASGDFDGIRLQPEGGIVEVWLRAPVLPGKRRLLVQAGRKSVAVP